MDGERAVIRKAVERPPGFRHEPAGEQAIRALIEEGAGLLTVPRCRQVQRLTLPHLDLPRHGSIYLDRLRGEPFPAPSGGVVAEQYAFGLEHLNQTRHDHFPHGVQTGRQDLGHEPAIVPVHHQ